MIRAIQDSLPSVHKVFRARPVRAAALKPLACSRESARALSLQQGRLNTRVAGQHALNECLALRQRTASFGAGWMGVAESFHGGDYSSPLAVRPTAFAGFATAHEDHVRRRQTPGMPCTGRGADALVGSGVGFAMGGNRATDSDS